MRLSTGALIALIDHSLSYHAALFFQGKSSQSLEVAPYALAIFYWISRHSISLKVLQLSHMIAMKNISESRKMLTEM